MLLAAGGSEASTGIQPMSAALRSYIGPSAARARRARRRYRAVIGGVQQGLRAVTLLPRQRSARGDGLEERNAPAARCWPSVGDSRSNPHAAAGAGQNICSPCLHRAPVALAPLVIRWGPDASGDMLRRCARCQRCGHRGATLQHPGRIENGVGWAPSR